MSGDDDDLPKDLAHLTPAYDRALRLADALDGITALVARGARWALLANALLITANALSRKFLGVAWSSALDLQWHFFAAVVLLTAAYALQRDLHVRMDALSSRLGERGQSWIDLLGILLVLLPLCLAAVWSSYPGFAQAFVGGETRASRESTSTLPAWIMKGFIPLGFGLLVLQGIAEAVRCVASIAGVGARPDHRRRLLPE
ncbi:TRAP transporter small permease subunit [Roseomonas mucosa]|uniref:TRAP transporter small permease subunit n=1 Tax=Roseomonas mucosa TaxID=207340 RepID=UPI0038507DB2